MADLVCISALALSAIIVLVLLAQYLHLLSIGRWLKDKTEHANAHLAEQRRYERENRELRSALRAEREHVQQLVRKVELLHTVPNP
jgi:hypothetical protein